MHMKLILALTTLSFCCLLNAQEIPTISLDHQLELLLNEDQSLSVEAAKTIALHPQINLFSPNEVLHIEEAKKGAHSAHVYILLDELNTPRWVLKELTAHMRYAEKSCLEKNQATIIGDLNRLKIEAPEKFPTDIQTKLDKLPHICLVAAFIEYKDACGAWHTVEIIEPAEGRALRDWLDDENVDATEFAKKAHAVGEALGLFHYGLMSKKMQNMLKQMHPIQWISFVHGDFHSRNVFCSEHNKVFFIDNRSIHSGHNPFTRDVKKINNSFFRRLKKAETDGLTAFQAEKRMAGLIRFVDGYVSAFPAEIQDHLFDVCYYYLLQVIDPERNANKSTLRDAKELEKAISTIKKSTIHNTLARQTTRLLIEELQARKEASRKSHHV